MMNALASNLVHGGMIGRRQVQFGLAHGYTLVCLSAVRVVYSCSVTYVSKY
jgi:hypothetical protein